MQGGYFTYGLLVALAIALLIAATTDLRRRQIDNWLNGAIAAGAPLFWWSTGLSLWPDVAWQFGVALVTFTILAVLFALKAMGGGDVKLLTALALWIQPLWFLQLVVVMSLAGGLLTIVIGVAHIMRRKPGRVVVPYGVAIAGAGLWTLFFNYLPLMQVPASAGAIAG